MTLWDGTEELQVHFIFRVNGTITVAANRLIEESAWHVIEDAIHEMGCPDCLRGDWPEQ